MKLPKQKPLIVEDKNINQKSYVFDGIQYKDTPNDVLEHQELKQKLKNNSIMNKILTNSFQ